LNNFFLKLLRIAACSPITGQVINRKHYVKKKASFMSHETLYIYVKTKAFNGKTHSI